MTSLSQRLDQAFKEALRGKQAVALSTLRMLKTAVRHREVELKRQVTEEELLVLINTQAKQRREAIIEYGKAGRPDLANKEEEELSFLLSFLPPQLSQEELEEVVSRIIQEAGAAGPKDLGKVMKSAMAQLQGRADGKVVQEIVRRRLGS
ncbi:MAG: GatB/YqeY domain-containing protein [Syntrophales bacterium]|nr:GatB/YqeY domain-containing protein [Syntrophales bacterium]MDD5642511.1 GatB/YqeY domain-containing protein [Syntrophales bacterium]